MSRTMMSHILGACAGAFGGLAVTAPPGVPWWIVAFCGLASPIVGYTAGWFAAKATQEEKDTESKNRMLQGFNQSVPLRHPIDETRVF